MKRGRGIILDLWDWGCTVFEIRGFTYFVFVFVFVLVFRIIANLGDIE